MPRPVTAFLAAVLAAAPAAAAEAPDLPALLGFVPEAPALYEAAPVFAFADIRAAERAAGVTRPASEAALAAMSPAERKAWIAALGRFVAGPAALQAYGQTVSIGASLRMALGVDLLAVDRIFDYGAPPSTATVLAGPAVGDRDAAAAALGARGFELRMLGDVPVWHRYDDYKLVLGQKDPAGAGDILLGRLPRSERVAILPGVLVGSVAWPDMEATLDVVSGARDPAAGAALAALMMRGALGWTGGEPVQAVAFAGPALGGGEGPGAVMDKLFGPSGNVDVDDLAGRLDAEALPGYPLALFADIQAGADQVAVIALPYPDRAPAEAAARVLAARLEGFAGRGADAPVARVVGGRVESGVVDDPGILAAVTRTRLAMAGDTGVTAEPGPGGAVALVAIRYPLPEKGAGSRAGAVYAAWLDAVLRREFTPLAVP